MSYGLLRGAFRPADAICPLRSFMRQAKQLVEDNSRCVMHMQKALTQMNVRLDSVISNIMGKTGERILRAIIAGERDPGRLASLRDRRIKASADTIVRACRAPGARSCSPWNRRCSATTSVEQQIAAAGADHARRLGT